MYPYVRVYSLMEGYRLSLFVPTVFTESIIYILCQSMKGKLGLRFGEEPKRFTSCGRMESLSLF